ncbi:MAG: hypothetical protein H6716_26380 [Polyangiaceae bacterium]|nr:hypothetical protein [Polyangiaceae bacterium]
MGGLPEDPYATLTPPLWAKATVPQRDQTPCEMFVGDAARVPWPAATWDPKGSYDSFAVKPPESEWMYQGVQPAWSLARHMVNGVDELYLHLEHGGKHEGDEVIGFARILRVRDLTTVGVLANRYSHPSTVVCGQGSYRESALDVSYSGLADPFYARFIPDTAGWEFVPQNDEFAGTHGFDLDVPWGEYASATGGVVRLNPTTGLSGPVRTNSAARVPASLGDTALWTEDAEVWMLKGSAPARLLEGGPKYPCSIGVTPEWVFGVGEQTASGVCRSYPTNGRVWRAKRSGDGAEAVEFGPTITVESFLSFARGWGDYAGFMGTIQGSTELFVVRLTDWKTWQLKKADQDSLHTTAWGVDGEHLYVGIGHSNLELEELRRYPLAKLDDVAAIIPN